MRPLFIASYKALAKPIVYRPGTVHQLRYLPETMVLRQKNWGKGD